MTTNRYGWDKIAKVEVQTWTDEHGATEFAIVWVIDDEGSVYGVDIRHGEEPEQLAEQLRKHGWTNDRCVLYRAA